jgi:predicted nucleic acid-binding protein
MRVFFDTSAFVKRYVDEPGSDCVQELCSRADQIALSVVCFPEMISTLNRLVRERKVSTQASRAPWWRISRTSRSCT